MNIVYSNVYGNAVNKLEEIKEEKGNLVRAWRSCSRLEYEFADGEIWKWVKPNDSGRGIKYHKCWIDESSVLLKQYRYIILPSYVGCSDSEDILFFD